MSSKYDFTKKLLAFFRLDNQEAIYYTAIGSIVGIFLYFLLGLIKMPDVTYGGLDLGLAVFPLKGGVDLPLLAIIAVAALCGPFAGFVVGFTGSLLADIIFYQQIIALASVNLSFGLLGLIIGIPRYKGEESISNGKILGKFVFFSFLGFLTMFVLYLVSLIGIANQSFEGTLLFNVLPYFTIWLITVLLVGPLVTWVVFYTHDFLLKSLFKD